MKPIQMKFYEDPALLGAELLRVMRETSAARKPRTYGILFQVLEYKGDKDVGTPSGFILHGCVLGEKEHERFNEFLATLRKDPEPIGN
jgi:hypothetical protein